MRNRVDRAMRGVAALTLMALAGAAWGQNSLGDGSSLVRPLDRDLGRGVPAARPNTAANFQQELNLRNAIVTGNAAGGMSFRGDAGYSAPTEFRGSLGSNDLFAFRRDSLFSGFAGMGIRGTDALQYQFALSTGGSSGLLGAGALSRTGGGIGNQAPSTSADPRVFQEANALRDPSAGRGQAGGGPGSASDGSMMGMLRSPSAYVANRGIQSELMASFFDTATNINWGLTASSLRGVRMSRMVSAQEELQRPGAVPTSALPTVAGNVTQPGEASPVEGATRGPATVVPNSYQAMVERFRDAAAGRLQPPPVEQAVEPETPTIDPATGLPVRNTGTQMPGSQMPGSQIPGTGTPRTPGNPGLRSGMPTPIDPTVAPGTPEWERRLNEIRERLSADLLETNPGMGLPTLPNQPAGALEEENRTEGTSAGSLGYRPLDPEALRILRESAPRIDQYAEASGMPDPYTEHMAVAGRLLRNGAYFDAEERFTRAQSGRPDDYLATIGRFHAQIGAGMYLSAGMNLRRMLIEHPEAAATRFDAAMLPEPARLEKVADELRTNASRALAGQSMVLGTNSALLLAYVGYQRSNSGLVGEGLETYQRLLEASGNPAAGRTLLDLISQVWGGADATPVEGQKGP